MIVPVCLSQDLLARLSDPAILSVASVSVLILPQEVIIRPCSRTHPAYSHSASAASGSQR